MLENTTVRFLTIAEAANIKGADDRASSYSRGLLALRGVKTGADIALDAAWAAAAIRAIRAETRLSEQEARALVDHMPTSIAEAQFVVGGDHRGSVLAFAIAAMCSAKG